LEFSDKESEAQESYSSEHNDKRKQDPNTLPVAQFVTDELHDVISKLIRVIRKLIPHQGFRTVLDRRDVLDPTKPRN